MGEKNKRQASKSLIMNILIKDGPILAPMGRTQSQLCILHFSVKIKLNNFLLCLHGVICHAPTNLLFSEPHSQNKSVTLLLLSKFAHHSLSYTHFSQLGHEPKESSYKFAQMNINCKIIVSIVSTINYNGKNIPKGTACSPHCPIQSSCPRLFQWYQHNYHCPFLQWKALVYYKRSLDI